MKRITAFDEFHLRPLICGYIPLTAAAHRWNIVKSTGPFWRIYWNNRPGAIIRQDRRRLELKPGNIALVPPNAVFSTLCRTPCAIRHFYIHFHCFPAPALETARIVMRALTPAMHAMIVRVIEALPAGKNTAAASPAARARVSLATQALIAWTMAECGVSLARPPASDGRIVRALHYMAQRLQHPISNADLARQVGMSVGAFVALFHRQTGRTPHVYLRARRVEQACQLLHGRQLTIKQIAEQTGFFDTHHFSRAFKRLRGMTPAEFRAQNDSPFIAPG